MYVRNRSLIGGFSDNTIKWILFRNCHWDWRGITTGDAGPSDIISLAGDDNNFNTVRNIGFYECAGTKDLTQLSKTTQPDYWATNYNINGIYYKRCVTTGSYNHSISGKQNVQMKVTETFFRDTGNCASEAGQSMDHLQDGTLKEFTSARIEYLRCWFRSGGFSNDNQIAIRVKNTTTTVIDNCTFLNGWGCAIYVNLFSGVGGIVGLERDHDIVLVREPPYAQHIEITNCNLGNNDLIINCRGGPTDRAGKNDAAQETATVTNCTGSGGSYLYGRFNQSGYDFTQRRAPSAHALGRLQPQRLPGDHAAGAGTADANQFRITQSDDHH